MDAELDISFDEPTDAAGDAPGPVTSITLNDISEMTGIPVSEMSEITALEAACAQLTFRHPTPHQENDIQKRVAEALASPNLNRAGAEKLARWESGWQEILDRVRDDDFAPAQLTPQYFHHDTMRFRGRYIIAEHSGFEFGLYTVLRRVLFQKHLAEATRIIEFGCGTGINLHLLTELFDDKSLVGCDWARPSQEILAKIASATGRDLTGLRFDMFTLAGRESLNIDDDTAVMTLHALEQLGGDFRPFIDYLCSAKPRLCFHMEPIAELYDSDTPFDQVALSYHSKRNYLSGLLSYLDELESNGIIEILERRRLGFGSLHQEAYSIIVWQPR